MKVLVTGGAGYIGSIAVKNLLADGKEVVIFDNFSTGFEELLNPEATLVRGDLLNQNDLKSLFTSHKFDAVMHFAAFSLVAESVVHPEKYFKNNVEGSQCLFDAMLAHEVKKIIFSSTCAIFGEPQKIPIEENDPNSPINPYGESKLRIENILEEYDKRHGLKSVSLRYFNAAGADPQGQYGEMHQPETHIIPLVLKAAMGLRDEIQIFGTDYPTPDGTCIRDYIHVEDLIDAHLLALDYLMKKDESEKFNLGSEKGHSVKDIIEVCKTVTAKNFKVVEAVKRAGDPPILIASSNKIRKVLGWQAKRDLEEIVGDAWKFQQKLDY